MNTMLKRLCSFAILLFVTGNLNGQNSSSEEIQALSVEEVLQLPVKERKLVTVASNVVSDVHRQPVSVTSISKEQLQLSAGRTLSEAIMMYVPGFFLVEDQDDLIAGFRGLAPDNNSKVLLLIDGQNLNTEFFWGPPDAILNSINYDYIERVEVIRGPGSVTLGQGALLGVINIVTNPAKLKSGVSADVQVSMGKDQLYAGGANVQLNTNDISAFFHASQSMYEGQQLRNEGWATLQGNQGYQGGTVYDMGHRLRRTETNKFTGNVFYKNLQLGIVRSEQKRDLYNFYRDREVFQQLLTALNLGYNLPFGEKSGLKVSASVARDDFGLYSLTGTTMGGTRETRYGLKTLFNANDLFKGNRLAIGMELRRFDMGQKNRYRNNYIANVIGDFDPATANQELIMGYPGSINVVSFFLEDYYSLTDKLDLFTALRYDNHPYWGDNLSPRIGAIYSPKEKWVIRATYQTGFRGAVGLHYNGGYRRDGHLRATNYSQVDEASIPGEKDINSIQPESMRSFELAVNFKPTTNFTFDLVGFYNNISNVIDVGVFYSDPEVYQMENIGDDIPGDWNGYWFFKNTPGTFTQAGFEGVITYQRNGLTASVSHSITSVSEATQQQTELAESASSMYLAFNEGDLHFKAFPEGVTRINTMYRFWKDKVTLSVNALRYSKWFSPIGAEAEGGLILNAGLRLKPFLQWEFNLLAKNLTNERSLYPMNSNAGGEDVSPGTPGWEATTFWGIVRYKL